MLPQPTEPSRSASRLTRAAALAATAAITVAIASPVASAAPAHTPPSAAVPAAALTNDSPIVSGSTALALNGDLGLSGLVSARVGGGKVAHADHKITGGTVRLDGSVVLKAGRKSAKLTNLSIDIATGHVRASLDGSSVILGTVDTQTLHLHKKHGDKTLYVGIGFGDDNNIELTADAAAKLNARLGVELTEGDVLLTGTVTAGLTVDAALAADLGMDVDALIDASVDVDVDLNSDIALGKDVDLDVGTGVL